MRDMRSWTRNKSESSILTKLLKFALSLAIFATYAGSTAQALDSRCSDLFSARRAFALGRIRVSEELEIYESARGLRVPSRGMPYKAEHGWQVLERDASGEAKRVQVRLLVDNSTLSGRIQVIGPFNKWGANSRPGDFLRMAPGQPEVFTGVIEGLKHGTPYRLLLDGRQMIDPSATMFTTREYLEREGRLGEGDYLNSVFWDHDHPRQYKMKTGTIDLQRKPVIIAEVELHSLVKNFVSDSRDFSEFSRSSGFSRDSDLSSPSRSSESSGSNKRAGPRSTAETYKYIAESGVIEKLKEAGYNAVEMMPFNQSMDGDSWHLRYQVYGLFAPDSRYGNPAEFKMMIDAFHRAGIAVIMDAVVSHFPFHGNKGSREISGMGLDQWKKADGRTLFAGEKSPWDTYRYDYTNPYLRRYLIDSVLYMMNEYGIDGIRFDNIDGITASPGGLELVRELTAKVRAHHPRAFLIAESFSPPSDLLHRIDRGGFGMNTRNDGNLFNIWHHQGQSPTERVDMQAFRGALRDPWDWKAVPLLRYLTNHDESANDRGEFTGQYPASLIGEPHYAFNKIKVFDAFNMLAGSYHLSLPQARMMQTGSFYTNPAIEWNRAKAGPGKNLWDYFASLAKFVGSRPSAFDFESLHQGIENHVDNVNKVISIRRVDTATGREIYAIMNFSHVELRDYSFGVHTGGRYELVHDSDRSEFGGQGRVRSSIPLGGLEAEPNSTSSSNSSLTPHSSSGPQSGKPNSLKVPFVPPYGALIFETVRAGEHR